MARLNVNGTMREVETSRYTVTSPLGTEFFGAWGELEAARTFARSLGVVRGERATVREVAPYLCDILGNRVAPTHAAAFGRSVCGAPGALVDWMADATCPRCRIESGLAPL